MSRLMRIAGAILLESQHGYFVIGNFKRPCDFEAYGFKTPDRDTEAPQNPVMTIERNGSKLKPDPLGVLSLHSEQEDLATKIAEFFMIERNGSMSERLWDLVCESTKETPEGVGDASWLDSIPGDVWQCVRDSVLQC